MRDRRAEREQQPMGVEYAQYLIARDSDFRPAPEQVLALIDAWHDRGFIIPRAPARSQGGSTGARWLKPPRFKTDWPAGMEPARSPEPEIRPGFWKRLLGQASQETPSERWLPLPTPLAGESLSALANPYTILEWNGHPHAINPVLALNQAVLDGDNPMPHRLIIELSDDFVNPDPSPYGAPDGTEVRSIEPVCACGNDLASSDLGWLGQRIRRICPVCGRAFRPEDQIADIVEGVDGRKTPRPGGLCNRFGIIIDFDKDHPVYSSSTDGLVEAKVTPLFMQICRDALGVELDQFGYYS